jgi:hypothetical protein
MMWRRKGSYNLGQRTRKAGSQIHRKEQQQENGLSRCLQDRDLTRGSQARLTCCRHATLTLQKRLNQLVVPNLGTVVLFRETLRRDGGEFLTESSIDSLLSRSFRRAHQDLSGANLIAVLRGCGLDAVTIVKLTTFIRRYRRAKLARCLDIKFHLFCSRIVGHSCPLKSAGGVNHELRL